MNDSSRAGGRPKRRAPRAAWLIVAWSIGALACWVGPALAVDGVIEINQDKAVAAGGFPFIISASGSYA